MALSLLVVAIPLAADTFYEVALDQRLDRASAAARAWVRGAPGAQLQSVTREGSPDRGQARSGRHVGHRLSPGAGRETGEFETGELRCLKIQAAWPWADAITTAWQCIHALPNPP